MSIIDADFRYVMRKTRIGDWDGYEVSKSEPVLQWRKKLHDASRGYDDRFYWTEWRDVRTEQE